MLLSIKLLTFGTSAWSWQHFLPLILLSHIHRLSLKTTSTCTLPSHCVSLELPGADPKPHKLLPGSGARPAVAAPTSHHCCRTPLFRVEEKQQCFCLSRTLFSYKQGNSEGSDSERCVRSSGPGSRQQARPSKPAVKTQQPW